MNNRNQIFNFLQDESPTFLAHSDNEFSEDESMGFNRNRVSRSDAIAKYQKLPKDVEKRVLALKNLQLDYVKMKEMFYKEIYDLECKYSQSYQKFFNKRAEIVNAIREPTEAECDYNSDFSHDETFNDIEVLPEIDDDNKLTETVQNYGVTNNIKTGHSTSERVPSVKGIPDFWLTVLQNGEHTNQLIHECDIEILKCLVDIKCIENNGKENGFTLEFHFSKNKYFRNKKLTKQYFLDFNIVREVAFEYKGPETIRIKGCDIKWFKDKNTTVKPVETQHKNRRGKNQVLFEKKHSFFNFFQSQLHSLDDVVTMPPKMQEYLEKDIDTGLSIRDDLIPGAVLYFTGEKIEDFEDMTFENEEDEEESNVEDFEEMEIDEEYE